MDKLQAHAILVEAITTTTTQSRPVLNQALVNATQGSIDQIPGMLEATQQHQSQEAPLMK